MFSLLLIVAGAGFAAAPVLDENGDGKIAKDEYIKYRIAIARSTGKKITEEELENAFEKTDKNKDGFLSLEERQASSKKNTVG